MFTTKPALSPGKSNRGLSCASCEKGLTDMYGVAADFVPWNKMSFRGSADRIAKVGAGFSKM